MQQTMSYYDLLEACTEEGCPVCRLSLAAVQRWMEAINYESVGDPGLREQLRASWGFCNVHAQQWLGLAHVLGTATIYVDVLTQRLAAAQALSFHPQSFLTGVAARLAPHTSQDTDGGRLVPNGRCPACEVRAEAEHMLVRTLLATLPQPAVREAYMASAGVCLPHLRQALGQVENEATFTILRDVAIAGEERLLAQLRDIIRKHDYRFRDESVGAERGAAERAVHHVIGEPGIPG